jgi:mannose/fructose/N-acetylgalactosamine-specific phosphotransferase system component IIC
MVYACLNPASAERSTQKRKRGRNIMNMMKIWGVLLTGIGFTILAKYIDLRPFFAEHPMIFIPILMIGVLLIALSDGDDD